MSWLDIDCDDHGHDRGGRRRNDPHRDDLSFGKIHPGSGVYGCFSRTSLLESPL